MTALAAHINDDLDDNLDSFLADAGRELIPVAERVTPVEIPLSVFYDPCKACGGSGNFRSYTGRVVGQCFKCKGAGKIAFKTSPEQRAANRSSVNARKERTAAEQFEAFAKASPDEAAWMKAASARGFGFAVSMAEAVGKYGHLTERQLAAVQKCMASDAARVEQRAAEDKAREEREASAQAIDITRIVASMTQAMEKGVKRPILRLDAFRFSMGRDAHAGTIFVRDANDSERYLGKIADAKFVRARACTLDEETRIIEAAANPAAAARTYGFRTGNCSCCGRELTNHESIGLGVGPICAGRFF